MGGTSPIVTPGYLGTADKADKERTKYYDIVEISTDSTCPPDGQEIVMGFDIRELRMIRCDNMGTVAPTFSFGRKEVVPQVPLELNKNYVTNIVRGILFWTASGITGTKLRILISADERQLSVRE